MADFADSFVRAEMVENKMRLPISPDKPADVASPYAISSSIPEAAKNNDEEFTKIDQSHREVLETSCELITCGNGSCENASIKQEISRYQKCNRVMALQGDKNDAHCTRSNNRCGMHEDLLFDIMLWLPVASLLRFRSVCRLWCSLIDSSTFITQHYNHNGNKSNLLGHHVLSSYGDADYDSKFCLLSGNKYRVYSNLDYEQPWYSVNEIFILNSCNGIVSLLSKNEYGDVALWNPATKQLRPLPKSLISSLCDGRSVKYGFGFDTKSNDYKFVKILYRRKNKHMVEIYNLRTDSWRTIHKDHVLPFKYIDTDSNVATYKKGTCFWIGYTPHDKISPILISLDLNTEVFGTVPLPRECSPNYRFYPYNALDILNDKLCYIKSVIFDTCDIHHINFEIWMLDENGAKESWKKICKYGPVGSSEREPSHVLGLSKNGEFLVLGYSYRYGELYLSSFDHREEEYLEIKNFNPLPSKFFCWTKLQNSNLVLSEFVVWYNESLVSLKREHDGACK